MTLLPFNHQGQHTIIRIKVMSQEQYTAIQQTSLKDLAYIPAKLLFEWLETKPDWLQHRIVKTIK